MWKKILLNIYYNIGNAIILGVAWLICGQELGMFIGFVFILSRIDMLKYEKLNYENQM